jgi:UDP-N-acetylglucosamine--N-acetylmuramyl-(pentapeptide) pyrophosphoryl-undecaprenol N-acetylglucosamine transferase
MLKAAQKKGIPTLIQEQNSYAGVTNKMLANNAHAICVAYDGMERFFPAQKIVLTGNPVRSNLLQCTLSQEDAKAHYGLDPKKRTVLIIGGSLGARTINNSISAGLERIANEQNLQFIWQTGKFYDEACKKALEQSPANNVKQMAFVNDMDIAYRAADLVVSRAGASSISELQLLGKPCILVPSPNVAEDHQTKNARDLVDKGAAMMVSDADAADCGISTALKMVADEALLAKLSKNIEKLAMPNAAASVADEIVKWIK